MKVLMIVLGTVLLFALLVVPSTPASAASAPCVSSPAIGPLGTTFVVTCAGFAPGESVYVWLSEPDGSAEGWGAVKAHSDGSATFSFQTRYDYGFVTWLPSLGEWAATMKGKSAIGIGRFRITGGTEAVKGATLAVVDPSIPTLVGSGFTPGEIVTVWIDYPNGDCSGAWDGWFYFGESTESYGNFKADSAGNIAFTFFKPHDTVCYGTYHLVARGNTSGLGAETWWSTPNHPTSTNATLVANPSSVASLGGFIAFTGSGFAPNTAYTCWETTPQSAVLPVWDDKTDSAGNLSFGFRTGTFVQDHSEGALGQWAVTCRDGAGNTAIARFSLFGNTVDP